MSYFKILLTISELHPLKKENGRINEKTGEVVRDPKGDVIYDTIKKVLENAADISALCSTQASKNDAMARFPTEGPAIEAKYLLFLGQLKEDQEDIKEFNDA